MIKDILLSGIYDLNVRHEVLGTAGIEEKSVNDLVRIVEAKEAAGGSRLATAAAATTSYKSSKQDAGSRPQHPPRPKGASPNGARPKKLRCRCSNKFTDFAVRPDGSSN